jgi:hypothetical protein
MSLDADEDLHSPDNHWMNPNCTHLGLLASHKGLLRRPKLNRALRAPNRVVKRTPRSQRNRGYRADSGPSRGDQRRRGIRPNRSRRRTRPDSPARGPTPAKSTIAPRQNIDKIRSHPLRYSSHQDQSSGCRRAPEKQGGRMEPWGAFPTTSEANAARAEFFKGWPR